jgi:glycosyltransferase involved in cell wall biosynthesis
MPGIFARASCVVLASLPTPSWEEQFGMVLAEAMASGVPIIASASGAIPEVLGPDVPTFGAGDWQGLATLLSEGPLAQAPGARAAHDPVRLERYSSTAAAARLADAYRSLLRS